MLLLSRVAVEHSQGSEEMLALPEDEVEGCDKEDSVGPLQSMKDASPCTPARAIRQITMPTGPRMRPEHSEGVPHSGRKLRPAVVTEWEEDTREAPMTAQPTEGREEEEDSASMVKTATQGKLSVPAFNQSRRFSDGNLTRYRIRQSQSTSRAKSLGRSRRPDPDEDDDDSGEDAGDRMANAVTDAPTINWRALRRGLREGNIRDHFVWSEEDQLGEGSFGRVFRGRSRYSSTKMVAVKQLTRTSVDSLDSLWSEISILAELDHPNILRFLEAFEDSKFIYIVSEVCLGGSLVDWCARVKGDLTFARRVAKEVTGVLSHCHARGICHRDLKLDNILLVRDSKDSSVRVADFGLAKRTSRRILTKRLNWHEARSTAIAPPPSVRSTLSTAGEPVVGRMSSNRKALVRLQSFKGTPEYMAPEVLKVLDAQVRGNQATTAPFYDFRCDVWSLGVVIFNLLTGAQPYSLEEVSSYVAEGEPLPSKARHLAAFPPEVASFLSLCLEPDMLERATAEELLDHQWLGSLELQQEPSHADAAEMRKRLLTFATLSPFKRAALLAAVRHLPAYEHEQLRKLFQKVDLDNSGEVTVEELQRGLAQVVTPKGGSTWFSEVVDKVDHEHKGRIDFTEFMAAIMDPHIEDREDLALAAFRGFDLNNDGALSRKELEYILKGATTSALSDDFDKDSELSFEEFVELLRKG